REGYSLGALCVIDRKPRDISVSEKEFLRRIASMVVALIEAHLTAKRLSALVASLANEAQRSAALEAGERLLQALAERRAHALDVAYVCIGGPGEHGAEAPATIAFYAPGGVTGQDRDYYRAANWPYAPLLRSDQDELYYASHAQDEFPPEGRMDDALIESYAG